MCDYMSIYPKYFCNIVRNKQKFNSIFCNITDGVNFKNNMEDIVNILKMYFESI